MKLRYKLGFVAVSVILLAVSWAYFWPMIADDDGLLAPQQIDQVFPLRSPTLAWDAAFAKKSKLYDPDFLAISSIINKGDVSLADLLDAKQKSANLLKYTQELASLPNLETPYFSGSGDAGMDYHSFKGFIDFSIKLRELDSSADLSVPVQLSLVLLERSKCLVDYMIALSSLHKLHRAGAPKSQLVQFSSSWKSHLARSVKLEYYYSSSDFGRGSGFLYQENATRNMHWSNLIKLGALIEKGEFEDLNRESIKIVSLSWDRPYVNLFGRMGLSLSLPSFRPILAKSIELESSIEDGA